MSKERRTTQFLDLEDISLRCVFQYLSIQDRFTFYFDLSSCRIQSLLENFISFVNISNENDQWIENYLPKALIQRKIVGLCLKERQIEFVSKHFSLGDIQRIYLITTYNNDRISANKCFQLSQCLNKLVLVRDKIEENEGILIYPIIGQNYIFPNLTILSMNLSKIDSIFIILQRLPNLQILKMHLENSHSYVESEIDIDYVESWSDSSNRQESDSTEWIKHTDNIIESCPMLRNVTITGVTLYCHEFKMFFTIFGSTIQLLTMNITILDDESFFTQFQHDIIDKMPLLSSFNFLIKWNRENFDELFIIDTQIFQTNNWQRFGHIVRCYNKIIYNLPYKFNCFEIMTNHLNLLYTGNKPLSPISEHVHTILLTSQDLWWSFDTFNFIRNNFPNVRTLYFHCKIGNIDDDYVQTYDIRFPELFNNDFPDNMNELQLFNVTTVYLDIELQQFDHFTFRYLFNLLPNLTIIETNKPGNARECVNRCYNNNNINKNQLDRLKIEYLHIPQYINSLTELFYYLCEC